MAKKKTAKKVAKRALKKVPIKNASDIMPVFNPGLPVNPTVSTIFSDTIESIYRTDGLMQLRFFTKEPGANVESARVVLPMRTMQAIIDNYCGATKYIPNQKK